MYYQLVSMFILNRYTVTYMYMYQSSTLPPVRRTCPVILFVGQVNHAKSHVRLSGDDISYFFMRVSPYLVPWLRELHVIVQCRMCAAHWYIHIL